MSRFELPPQYDPHAVERPLYGRWLERGVFTARADSPKPPYVIVIPPPNVTAVLPMGQGLNNVPQDVLIRFERMRGREALWLPGTDHAGIATQNVVERLIAKEGNTRFDLGRDAFVARVWAFVKETGGTILEQLKMIGASCDWSRTRFTFDPAYSRAVREVFVRLWEEGLIYRGHRVIHWCPRCLTALSDEEAESKDIDGKLYYIRYPVEGGPEPYLTVATTRPETLLGDTAVAVNPKDARHRASVGKVARLPIIDLPVPIIADDAVELGFGTGFVKVTPAHDATDFEIGLRHKLEMPLVMTEDGRMEHPTRVPKTLAELDRFEARDRIVDMLKEGGLLEKVEPHRHAVRHCYRCDSVVEPRLSDQWFVKMKPLAAPALEAYRSGAIRLVPERWGATYEHWMENIRDWNISRQLWWGHRIPVFNCTKCAHQWADREDPTACPKCGGRVEPLDVVRLFGADALRWTAIAGVWLGSDLILDPNDLETTFAPGRNFANKLWNIGRFILAQLPERVQPLEALDAKRQQLADRWILSRAQGAIRDVTASLETFRLDEAAKRCFDFVWKELADWYVEGVKPRLGDAATAPVAQSVLAYCFDTVLRLLHPVVPFITEELWQKLPGRSGDELLAAAAWPTVRDALTDPRAEARFALVQDAIAAIRTIRAEYRVSPKARLTATVTPKTAEGRGAFEGERETIVRLGQLEALGLDGRRAAKAGAHAVLADGSEVFVALSEAIDVQQECRRLSGELTRLEQQLAGLAAKLTNQQFVARAPAEVVAKEREKERAWHDQRQVLADKLKSLGCS